MKIENLPGAAATFNFQLSIFNSQTIYNMTPEEIIKELEQQQLLLNNYLDLTTDMEDDASYIARGNGFCDAKYSEDFLQGQTEKIRKRIAELQRSLQ